ncbi:DUF1853 family protein [Croceivirga thetidis]|uniref:DUF1853 family protein n=1 Tax=Croceivirga thetidis TaxID=2721623 RepID=A0ABX1GTM7_9FLAO|nr:DUF1853 family protein [Croceivirga thetidis]
MNALLNGFYETAPLWKNQQFGLKQFVFPEVDLSNPEPFELPTNLRLGHQMEHVFKHLVSISSTHEVIFSNLLIEEGKIRVGELDFILKDVLNGMHLHVELAYKFYIINPEISEPIYRLMGPNKRDMFYTKLDKLKEKQLPLLHHESLLPYWKSHDINPFEINQQCCFKAQLFEPYVNKSSIRPLNGDCIVGNWVRFDEFNSKEFGLAQFYIPHKTEWVLKPHQAVDWKSHFEILMEVNLHMIKENSPMLWIKHASGEMTKLFVVWW